jgi:hypothetical protein
MLKKLLCVCVILVAYIAFWFARQPRTSDTFFIDRLNRIEPNSTKFDCLARWILSGGMAKHDPVTLLAWYAAMKKLDGEHRLKVRTVVAILESAIWLQNEPVARAMLEHLAKGSRTDFQPEKLMGLQWLFGWRFSSDPALLLEQLAPHPPITDFLPFLMPFAKAVTLDAKGQIQDAVQLYKLAIDLLPEHSHERSHAIDRCNALMNRL